MGNTIRPTTSRGQLVCLAFMQDAVAASQTDVQLPIVETFDGTAVGTNSADEVVMPWDWEVVGVSYELSAAATAGQLTVGATDNGTEDADTTITITTTTTGYKRVPRGAMAGVAGRRIGAEITTNGAWDGTTADLVVSVWVLVYLDGI